MKTRIVRCNFANLRPWLPTKNLRLDPTDNWANWRTALRHRLRRRHFLAFRSGANPEGSLAHRLGANLRSRRQLALFTLAFLLMGGFVALYNFLGFRLTGAPVHLSPSVVSLVFLAYLAGTWASGGKSART